MSNFGAWFEYCTLALSFGLRSTVSHNRAVTQPSRFRTSNRFISRKLFSRFYCRKFRVCTYLLEKTTFYPDTIFLNNSPTNLHDLPVFFDYSFPCLLNKSTNARPLDTNTRGETLRSRLLSVILMPTHVVPLLSMELQPYQQFMGSRSFRWRWT